MKFVTLLVAFMASAAIAAPVDSPVGLLDRSADGFRHTDAVGDIEIVGRGTSDGQTAGRNRGYRRSDKIEEVNVLSRDGPHRNKDIRRDEASEAVEARELNSRTTDPLHRKEGLGGLRRDEASEAVETRELDSRTTDPLHRKGGLGGLRRDEASEAVEARELNSRTTDPLHRKGGLGGLRRDEASEAVEARELDSRTTDPHRRKGGYGGM